MPPDSIIGFAAVRKAALGVGCGRCLPARAVGGARCSHVAVPVALAGKRQRVVRRCQIFVDRQQIEKVIVRAAGKAVYFLPLCVVSHGGIAVEMLRIQAAKALLRVNAQVVVQTRSKYAYLSQSLLKGTHEPALQNF